MTDVLKAIQAMAAASIGLSIAKQEALAAKERPPEIKPP